MNRTSQQSKKPTTTSNSNTTSEALRKTTNIINVSSSEEVEDKSNNLGNSILNINSTNSNTNDESDVYEFHASKESSGPGSSGEEKIDVLKGSTDKSSDDKNATDTDSSTVTTSSNLNTGPGSKRPFTEVESIDDQIGININESDEIKRKKRKEGEIVGSIKDSSATTGKSVSNVRVPIRQEKGKIPGPASKTMNIGAKGTISSDIKKSPCPSPKPATSKSADSDVEQDDGNVNSSGNNDGPPKVPPLKIVIPQQSNSGDAGDSGTLRNGKNASTRSHPALPYVVASSNR